MPGKLWDENTNPIAKFQRLHFNGATIEVWKWISNFIPHLIMGEIAIHAGIKVNPC